MRHLSFMALPLLTASLALPAAAQDHHHPAGDASRLGAVTFPVSCAPAAAERVQRGVAMLHSFWFQAAESEFTAVIAAQPDCAMAHWGLALTQMANPMTRAAPTPDQTRTGAAAIERARELAGSVTHREQMYIDAVAAYYRDHATRPHLERMELLEQGFAALAAAHPEDMEAAIFLARTKVANADPADQTYAKLLAAATIMEPLFEEHPQHPGLAHYLIHAYDVPALAGRGEGAAFAYADIAPDAPHALHMPSHIFTRRGYWDESIETNARSARAEPDSNAAVHPNDYMVYAYLQQGRDAEARRVVERVQASGDVFYAGLISYNQYAMPARFAVERNAWAEAAQLQLPERAPAYVTALTVFARAIGLARSGDAAGAAREAEGLHQLHTTLAGAGDSYWAGVVEAQRRAALSWAAHARGASEEALRLGREAADLEDTFEKHPVTPGPLLPARELLGDLLLELGRPAEARVEYEKTLEREPRRARALYGAARAAELAGDRAAATAHYREILEVMEKGEPQRVEIREARRFLGSR